MTASRWLAGLAAVLTAMLLQATLIGPLVVPLPASLPLVVVAGIAVLAGPSTGITLGFAAGLLVDLGSQHAVGVLALTWLGVGLVAGVVGGMVVPVAGPAPVGRRRGNRRSVLRRTAGLRPAGFRAARSRPVTRRPFRPSGVTGPGRRSQALLVGLLGGLGALATAVVLAVVNEGTEPFSTAAVRCLPAAVLDAFLALLVLPVLAGALGSGSLQRSASGASPSAAGLRVGR